MIAAQGFGYKLSRGRDSSAGDGGSSGDLGEGEESLWAAADLGRHKDLEKAGCSCYHPLQKVLVQTCVQLVIDRLNSITTQGRIASRHKSIMYQQAKSI